MLHFAGSHRPADGAPILDSKGERRLMNPLDMGIVSILGFCLIRGIFRGMIREASGIIGVCAGFYAAYTYYDLVAVQLQPWLKNPDHARLLAFLVLFLGIFVAVSLLGVVIRKLLHIVFLGWVDRLTGAAFGLFKGILVVSVILMVMTAFMPKNLPLLTQSTLAPRVMGISTGLSRLVPNDLEKRFQSRMKALKRKWNGGKSTFGGIF